MTEDKIRNLKIEETKLQKFCDVIEDRRKKSEE